MLSDWFPALTKRDRFGFRPAVLSLLVLGSIPTCLLAQSSPTLITQPHPRNVAVPFVSGNITSSDQVAVAQADTQNINESIPESATSELPQASSYQTEIAPEDSVRFARAFRVLPSRANPNQIDLSPTKIQSSLPTSSSIATTGENRPSLQTMRAVEPPPGWNAVEKRIREQLETCDAMLRRGAIYSARQTCWQALEELCRVLDLHRPEGKRVEALRRAMVAMREEEDFYRYSSLQNSRPDLISNLSWSHETPVIREWLKQQATSATSQDAQQISPLIAAQHYRSYAREQLIAACDHHPWAADLLYALGKTLEKQAWEDSSRSALIQQHAEIIYQAALETNPKQFLAATQLGYVLLQLDRPQEARDILVYSVNGLPTTAGYQNLREACRRLNDQQGMAWSTSKWAELQAREAADAADIPFTEIDSRQFAAISAQDMEVTRFANNPAVTDNRSDAQYSSQTSAVANPTKQTAKRGWLPEAWR
ncbi:MAG: hypothetical protein RLY14_731 [Planctomycetota bacterium]|jgi:hypothetical protein